ncbi:MAG: hypothetical protein HRU09_14985 [Oligoflexales bacterium]|nr:hypothetical protein [Oligoflexales bacterium]
MFSVLLLALMPVMFQSLGLGFQPCVQQTNQFEGWYARVTDEKCSFAIIAGENVKGQKAYPMVSYIFNDQSGKTERKTWYPDRYSVDRGNNDFIWRSNGCSFSKDHIKLNTDDLNLDVSFVNRRPLYLLPGPEFPFEKALSSHWNVFGVADASYQLKTADTEIKSRTAKGHIETNWGQEFPESWVWSQAIDLENDVQLVFAGGKPSPKFKPPHCLSKQMTVWSLAIRDRGMLINLNPIVNYQDSNIETDHKSFIKLKHDHFTSKRLEIELNADPSTFIDVPIPSDDGWSFNAFESFEAEISLKITDVFTGTTYQKKFKNAALEFGEGA